MSVESNHHDPRFSGKTPQALLNALLRPEFYPHRPAAVEMRQTHVSYVFIADDYVFKIKKVLRFPFLDASTLERRRALCQEEVRLNRRLAPDVYLGVMGIVESSRGYALAELADCAAHPAVREYAVKMRRLPADRMLDWLIAHNPPGPEVMHQLAQRLVAFHREASAACGWAYGSASAVSRMLARNLAECERFEGFTTSAAQIRALAEFNRSFIADHWGLINRRAREGRVREGHGDLRCEHICIAPDGAITIFDCIEFSESLRYADVACEVAFLAMDLDYRGAQTLAGALVQSYARLSDDAEFAELMPLYKCYRAAVRAKVESLKSLSPRSRSTKLTALARWGAITLRWRPSTRDAVLRRH